MIAYLSVETGIPISVLLSEPEDYINAMLFYLRWRNDPQARSVTKRGNAQALSELDRLL